MRSAWRKAAPAWRWIARPTSAALPSGTATRIGGGRSRGVRISPDHYAKDALNKFFAASLRAAALAHSCARGTCTFLCGAAKQSSILLSRAFLDCHVASLVSMILKGSPETCCGDPSCRGVAPPVAHRVGSYSERDRFLWEPTLWATGADRDGFKRLPSLLYMASAVSARNRQFSMNLSGSWPACNFGHSETGDSH